MCDALVPRLLTKPILATRDISHPLHTAAEAVITLQEFRFPRQKKRQLTALQLHRPTVENSCPLKRPTPHSDWISKENVM